MKHIHYLWILDGMSIDLHGGGSRNFSPCVNKYGGMGGKLIRCKCLLYFLKSDDFPNWTCNYATVVNLADFAADCFNIWTALYATLVKHLAPSSSCIQYQQHAHKRLVMHACFRPETMTNNAPSVAATIPKFASPFNQSGWFSLYFFAYCLVHAFAFLMNSFLFSLYSLPMLPSTASSGCGSTSSLRAKLSTASSLEEGFHSSARSIPRHMLPLSSFVTLGW